MTLAHKLECKQYERYENYREEVASDSSRVVLRNIWQ